MKVDINFQKLPHDIDVHDYLNRRIEFSFSRIHHNIDRISIALSSVNGSESSIKKCMINVKPKGLKSIVVIDQGEDIYSVIDQALSRSSLACHRAINKRKKVKRSKPIYLEDILLDKIS